MSSTALWWRRLSGWGGFGQATPAGMFAPLLIGTWAAAIAVAPTPAAKAVLAAPAALAAVAWWTVHKPGRWLAAFFAAALLLPPLPIPIGDSGPHPCLFFAALGLFAGMVWLGKWRIGPSGVGGALFTLFGLLLASVALAAVNSGGEVAAGSLARVVLFGISVYIFFYAAYGPGNTGRDKLERGSGLSFLYYVAVASALFACVDFYFQFPAPAGYGPQFVWLDSGVFRRAQGIFYEASTLGNFCAFFLVMIMVAFSRPREESPVPRKALLAGGAVFFAALVLSYSRASLINILVASAVLVWLNRKRVRFARIAVIVAVSAAAAGFLTWQIFPTFVEMYWMRLSNTAVYAFSATEGLLSGRVASWRTLVDWISAHPWQTLIGIGYKTLPYSDYVGGAVVADNMYLSLLVETGIAGLAAVLWLNVAILRAAARASRAADPRTSFCGAWMLCFWAGQVVQMFSGDLLTYWRVLPVYFWVLALAVRI
ncbi:MAG TPA: O-antigen ligase family protein [Bryobacteraceae bacterium]|nr:O-antigen ligase family protein [Bryobacteraceae bacterium]